MFISVIKLEVLTQSKPGVTQMATVVPDVNRTNASIFKMLLWSNFKNFFGGKLLCLIKVI